MDKSKLCIVIIDDGINQNLYKTGELKHNIEITSELHICERVGYDPFLPSHGTTCAAIIKKYAPDAVLSSIKILSDESRRGMKAQLIRALEWCAENRIQLVNMSLGTVDYRDFVEVEKAVKYAADNGVIIVAACNNRNIFTCPASLEDVIGVKRDDNGILTAREYLYNQFSYDGIEITACGKHHLIKYNGESKITPVCNSFTTPAVTSMVYDIIKNNAGICINELKKVLMCRSVNKSNIKVNECFQNGNICASECIDIPVIEVYNYYGKNLNEFIDKLIRSFRVDGYNAISIVEEAEKDVCNGRVAIKSVKNENKSLNESLQIIADVYDPDIVIVAADVKNNNTEYSSEQESSFNADITIKIYEDLSVGISTYETAETKTFTLCDSQMNYIYSYILGLFGTGGEKE